MLQVLMSRLRCAVGKHAWDGCTCAVCKSRRDEQHQWNGCTCCKCDSQRDQDHSWGGCTCTRCGKQQNRNHQWNEYGTQCSRCGTPFEISDALLALQSTNPSIQTSFLPFLGEKPNATKVTTSEARQFAAAVTGRAVSDECRSQLLQFLCWLLIARGVSDATKEYVARQIGTIKHPDSAKYLL